MTAHACATVEHQPAAVGRIARRYVVSVRDDVDVRLAGHHGGAYRSPPLPRDEALALVGLLLGGGVASEQRTRWTRAVAGGRRTITLTVRDAATALPAARRPSSAAAEHHERDARRHATGT